MSVTYLLWKRWADLVENFGNIGRNLERKILYLGSGFSINTLFLRHYLSYLADQNIFSLIQANTVKPKFSFWIFWGWHPVFPEVHKKLVLTIYLHVLFHFSSFRHEEYIFKTRYVIHICKQSCGFFWNLWKIFKFDPNYPLENIFGKIDHHS